MRAGGLVLIGVALVGAYMLGARSNSDAPTPAVPVALLSEPAPSIAPLPVPPSPPRKATPIQPNRAPVENRKQPISLAPPPPQAAPNQAEQKKPKIDTKAVLSAAAIAALIVAVSRSAYHATGRPCACPDDRTRGGQRCGRRSAYSRAGGAKPICFEHEVTAEMVADYRKRTVR